MANCCNNTPCEQILTLDYMKKLSSGSTCYTVPSHSSLSSCCRKIDGDGYSPTYGELTSGTYPIRRISILDAYNDVNGFIFTQPTAIGGDGCCKGSIDDMLVPRSAANFEFTKVDSVSANSAYIISGCECSKTIDWCGRYSRYTCFCGLNGEVVVIASQVGTLTGAASSTTVTFDYSESAFTASGEDSAEVTVPSTPKTITLTAYDKCEGSRSKEVTVTKQAVNFRISFDTSELESPIPCSGGTIILNKSEGCNWDNKFTYDFYTGGTHSGAVETENSEIVIPENEGNWDSIRVVAHISGNVCGATVDLTLDKEFEQDKCNKVVTLEECGIYWIRTELGNEYDGDVINTI